VLFKGGGGVEQWGGGSQPKGGHAEAREEGKGGPTPIDEQQATDIGPKPASVGG
jgi:hypothetical protein